MLYDFLIVIVQDVFEDGHDIAHDWEGILWDVSTAVGGCCDSCSLGACGEEIEERQARCETAFPYNDSRKFDGDLLQRAQTLLCKVDEVNLEQL